MTPNKTLVEKALITTDAIAASGKLNPEQADKFIDLVVDVTELKDKVRIVKFRNEQLDIDKINVGLRVAMPKAEATGTQARRGVSTSKISLNPVSIVVPFEISSDFMMENIQGESVEDTVIGMMSKQFANDIEELLILGNKLGVARLENELVEGGSATQYIKDSYLALQDGWLTSALQSHVVDANGANISSALFSKALNEMPDKWKRTKRNMKFFSSTDHEQNYRQTVSSRATAAGDMALSAQMNLTPYGVELVPLPLLPSQPLVVEHLVLASTTPVALKHKNVSDFVLTYQTLAGSPTSAIAGADYVLDAVNGTVARSGGSSLTDPVSVKATYRSQGQVMLTEYRNMIFGMGREITIKRDEDIYADTKQYAIHAKIACAVEELDALVLVKNIGLN